MNISEKILIDGFKIIDLIKKDEFDTLTDIVYSEFSAALDNSNVSNPLITKEQLRTYHKFSIDINHNEFWSKQKRIITNNNLNKILKMNFIKELKNIFGDFKISNEEGIQSEEIYWRLVRPKIESDVGPIHADKWFWEGMNRYNLIHKELAFERIKLWIPLYTELGISGLKIMPNSHIQEFDHEITYKNGRVKIDKKFDDKNLDFLILKLIDGQAVAFHDNLLHGGLVGENETRLSLEFTILKK